MTDYVLDVLRHDDPLLQGANQTPFQEAASAVDSFDSTTRTRLRQAQRCEHCARSGDPEARRRIGEHALEVLRVLRGTAARIHEKLSANREDPTLKARAAQLVRWQDQVGDIRNRYGMR